MDADAIEARPSARFRRGWIGFWVAWIAAGAALALWATPLFGLAMVAAFGGMLLLTLRRLADPRPVIRIGPGGYHDRRLGAPIPWAAIRSLRAYRAGRRLVLQIGVDDPAAFLGHAGILRGPMLRINPAMGMPALGSMLAGLDVPQERLAAAAEAWWAARAGPPA